MTHLTTDNRKWWVLIGVGIASFLGCIDFTIVNTALPNIQLALQASVVELQWIINIFILALSTFMVIMGCLADRYGRRLVLYIGMILFGFASLGAGLAATINELILFRLIQGISCAILYTATGAIVSNAFPVAERGKAIGTLFGINGIGLAIGPVLGGFIVSALSWRYIFLMNVPLILISLLICFASVRESRDETHGSNIDWWGFIILLIALPCFILGIIQGGVWGWNSPFTIGAFLLATILFCLFYFIEIKSKAPIIQFHLFANRTFISSVVATFSLALFYCLAFFLMPLYLHHIRHDSSYMVGLLLLPATAMVAILSPLVGRIVDRYGPKIPLLVGFVFFMLFAFLGTQLHANSSLFYILFSFTFMGIGWACILGPSTVASLSSVPENMAGVAMGTSWTLHNMGGAIGLGVGIVIYRLAAYRELMNDIIANHTEVGGWVSEAVANPDRAVTLLHQYTQFNLSQIIAIFQAFFIAGYQAAMWLLFTTSFLTFFIILLGMKKKLNIIELRSEKK